MIFVLILHILACFLCVGAICVIDQHYKITTIEDMDDPRLLVCRTLLAILSTLAVSAFIVVVEYLYRW